MITETQSCIVVLHLTDEVATRLQPFMAGLDITVCTAGHTTQRLSMRGEVYTVLVERVDSALDYVIRWQPNEYEPHGFVERVRPLQITDGVLVTSGCSQCGVQLLANRAEVVCACGQLVLLI